MTGRGKNNGFISEEWYKTRLPIFKKYTIGCLKNQTNKNFTHWISFRPQEKEHSLTKDFLNHLKDYPFLATFDGQVHFDDRGNNDTLEERLSKSLAYLKRHLQKTDWVYVTYMDSDEVIRNDVIEMIQKAKPEYHKAFIHKKGYAFNLETRQLADWSIGSAWSTWTLMYPYDVFFDAKKHLEYMNGWVTHEETPYKFNCVELPENTFITTIHGWNRSSIWLHYHKGKEYYYESEKSLILKKFKI